MRVLVFASVIPDADASAGFVRALSDRGHTVDLVAVDDAHAGSSNATLWRDATAVIGLARHADVVVHFWHPHLQGSMDWAAELPGVAIVDGDATPPLSVAIVRSTQGGERLTEQLDALVAGGDPAVAMRSIARAFGQLLAAWSVAPDSLAVARVAEELEIFD